MILSLSCLATFKKIVLSMMYIIYGNKKNQNKIKSNKNKICLRAGRGLSFSFWNNNVVVFFNRRYTNSLH